MRGWLGLLSRRGSYPLRRRIIRTTLRIHARRNDSLRCEPLPACIDKALNLRGSLQPSFRRGILNIQQAKRAVPWDGTNRQHVLKGGPPSDQAFFGKPVMLNDADGLARGEPTRGKL